MKNLFILFALAALVSCSDKDDNPIAEVNTQLHNAFHSKYPNAVNVVWGMRSNYHVADFKDPVMGNTLVDCEAWFSQQGQWHMTESDIPYEELPEPVRTAFEASEYADWFIEDIDKVEREGTATLYVIELEARDGQRTETDLYYLEDGTLVKNTLTEDDSNGNDSNGGDLNGDNTNGDDSNGNDNNGDNADDYTPEAPKGGVEEFIMTNYPDARILDYEYDDGRIEVEILDGKIVRELYFDADENWLRTTTELTSNSLPQAVVDALVANGYQQWHIDDVEHVLEPTREFYELELELGEREKNLRITPEGELL